MGLSNINPTLNLDPGELGIVEITYPEEEKGLTCPEKEEPPTIMPTLDSKGMGFIFNQSSRKPIIDAVGNKAHSKGIPSPRRKLNQMEEAG